MKLRSSVARAGHRAPTLGSSLPRKRAFILLRFGLIIAAAYVLIIQTGLSSFPPVLGLLVSGAVASNVALHWVPSRFFELAPFVGAVMIADTVGITGALLYSGSLSAEFFFVYFFVLFLAAIGENLSQIAIGAVVVAAGYLVAVSRTDAASLWTTTSLIRLPFLLMVASFYGYLVCRVRAEKHRASEEALSVERLRAAKVALSEKASHLEVASERLEREVVERREAEHELARANRKLEKMSQRKSDFVSAVSHELRTPLTSIKNSLNLLGSGRTGSLTDKQQRFLNIANRNAARLTAIINDLLDLSKIESGKLGFKYEEANTGELLEAVVESFGAQTGPDAPALQFAYHPQLPSVWVDPQRIEQVLTNLLSNAFKFTPAEGCVTLTADLTDHGVEIRVTDTGIGLPAEELERIFDRFYQVQEPLTRAVQGSGLGLSIVRRMLAAHGSSISVESEPGKGSSFFFTLAPFSAESEEMCALEEAVQEARSQANTFSLLIVRPLATSQPWPDKIDSLHHCIRNGMPRSSDRVIAQQVHERVVVLLLGTALEGAVVVEKRLRSLLANAKFHAEVSQPVVHPQDGTTAKELITRLNANQAQQGV